MTFVFSSFVSFVWLLCCDFYLLLFIATVVLGKLVLVCFVSACFLLVGPPGRDHICIHSFVLFISSAIFTSSSW